MKSDSKYYQKIGDLAAGIVETRLKSVISRTEPFSLGYILFMYSFINLQRREVHLSLFPLGQYPVLKYLCYKIAWHPSWIMSIPNFLVWDCLMAHLYSESVIQLSEGIFPIDYHLIQY